MITPKLNHTAQTTLGRKRDQHGAVLAVSLIFLLIMTILGISAMKSTVLEEKMAGNLRDQSLAFQAAEAALRDGEAFIENDLASTGAFTCTDDMDTSNCTAGADGQYVSGSLLDTIISNDPWTTTKGSVAASSTIEGVATGPRYFIIHNTDLVDATKTSLNMGPGYGGQKAGKDVTTFMVVARGTGGTDKAPVTLTTYYGKRF